MATYPRRFGGGGTRAQELLGTLNADRGGALDAFNPETIVYVENLAIARAISGGWGTNERLSHLWDSKRASMDIIARWEKILALSPAVADTDTKRRARVQDVFERFGQPALRSRLFADLSENLGDAFVAVEYIDASNAIITVPDDTYPWGTVVADKPWSSSVAHLLVRLQKPAGWSEGDFYEATGRVVDVLEPLLPCWVTFDWYRAPTGGAPIVVIGGPSAAGIYLDQPANLDNHVFD